MSRPIWFAGTCDLLLQKIKAWHEGYDQGKAYSTRQWMNMQGQIVPFVTKRAHTIGFSKAEIDNLRSINNYYCVDPALKQELDQTCAQWESQGRLLPKGLRSITVVFFPEHVKDIYDMVAKARREYLSGGSVDEFIKQQQDQGKDLFEV